MVFEKQVFNNELLNFVAVGNFEKKNFDRLIKIFSIWVGYHLYIIGEGPEHKIRIDI